MIYVFKPQSGHVIPPNSRKNPFGHFQEFRNMKNALLPPCPILLPLNWLILRQDKGKIPTKCMSGTPFLLLSKSPLPYAHSMYGHVGRWAEVSWCHSEISFNRWLSNFYRNGGSAPGHSAKKLTNRIVTLGFPFLYGSSPFVIIHYSPQNSLLSSPNVVLNCLLLQFTTHLHQTLQTSESFLQIFVLFPERIAFFYLKE